MKSLLSIIIALASTTASADCLLTMEKAALEAVSYEKKVNVKNVEVIRSEMGVWTEAVGNNTGSGEFALLAKGQMNYVIVYASQIGTSAKCKVAQIDEMTIDEVNPLALQSEKYKLAIGNALHISEGDSEWSAFHQRANVTAFTQKQIAAAMNIKTHFEIYTEQETINFLVGYAVDSDDEVDGPKYQALLDLMKKDFNKKFRMIKVGEPDSGGMELYLIGITPEGNLVGLKTISVET